MNVFISNTAFMPSKALLTLLPVDKPIKRDEQWGSVKEQFVHVPLIYKIHRQILKDMLKYIKSIVRDFKRRKKFEFKSVYDSCISFHSGVSIMYNMHNECESIVTPRNAFFYSYSIILRK